jgi:WD40 repeat protein
MLDGSSRCLASSLAPFDCPTFTSDGTRLIVAEGHENLGVWNLESGALSARRTMGHASPFELAVSPDNKILATSNNLSDAIRLWRLSTLAQIGELPVAVSEADCLGWAPRGHLLAYSIDEKTVVMHHIETNRIERRFQHTTPLRRLAFTPDGRYLATTSQALDIWDVSTAQVVHSIPQGHTDIAAALDRNLIAAASGSNVTLVDLTAERPQISTIVTVGSDVTALAIHGNTLAVAFSQPSAVSLWDLRTRQVLLHLNCDLNRISGTAFSPDGRRLVATGTTVDGKSRILEWTIQRDRR